LLCARALIRQDRLDDARQRLARSVSSHRTPNNYATHLMFSAVIQAREGYISEAETLFARALELKAHHTIIGEIRYERALAQYLSQRYDDARATLQLIRPFSGVVYAQAIALEGWLDSAAGDFRSAQAAFGEALTALNACKAVDMYLRASIVYALSLMVAELDHSHADRLITEAQRVSWNQSLIREQVQTLRHIGLVHRRAGRADEAMRLFGATVGIEPGSPWQIMGLAECACLCVDRDNPVAAGGYVAAAQCLVDQIEWATVFGEQRAALLVLAQALARLGDGVAARTLTEQFGTAPQSAMPRLSAQYNDDRLWTYVQHTVRLVQAACGDNTTARQSLSDAHRAWSRIGFRWRALEALDDIKRLDPRRTPDGVLGARPTCIVSGSLAGTAHRVALPVR
jgi:tetratricopeptide (TPR) repeat protein